jgi:hypothetical protein
MTSGPTKKLITEYILFVLIYATNTPFIIPHYDTIAPLFLAKCDIYHRPYDTPSSAPNNKYHLEDDD